MKMTVQLIVLAAAAAFSGAEVIAQTAHYSFAKNTGLYATVAIPASIAPTCDGMPLAIGDEVGVFTASGVCAGASVWTGLNIALNVWPDDPYTPAVDGMQAGEEMAYRIWRKGTNTEYPIAQASYQSGGGAFSFNGLYVLASLAAYSSVLPNAPTLRSPADGATGVPLTAVLQWDAVDGATEYLVHLSADSAFASLLDPAIVSETQKRTPPLQSGSTYYWRVRSGNMAGVSAFSGTFRFSTLTVTGLSDEDRATRRQAREFRLEQNYPNPFNPETQIAFSLPRSVQAKLSIYDVLGREVAVLIDARLDAGWYTIGWNASGRASGVYLCRLRAGTYTSVRMMMLAR